MVNRLTVHAELLRRRSLRQAAKACMVKGDGSDPASQAASFPAQQMPTAAQDAPLTPGHAIPIAQEILCSAGQ